MTTMSLSDGVVVLANLGVLICTASDILHDIDRNDVSPEVWGKLMRAQSLFGIAHNTCELTVVAIESGPDYSFGGVNERDRHATAGGANG